MAEDGSERRVHALKNPSFSWRSGWEFISLTWNGNFLCSIGVVEFGVFSFDSSPNLSLFPGIQRSPMGTSGEVSDADRARPTPCQPDHNICSFPSARTRTP